MIDLVSLFGVIKQTTNLGEKSLVNQYCPTRQEYRGLNQAHLLPVTLYLELLFKEFEEVGFCMLAGEFTAKFSENNFLLLWRIKAPFDKQILFLILCHNRNRFRLRLIVFH